MQSAHRPAYDVDRHIEHARQLRAEATRQGLKAMAAWFRGLLRHRPGTRPARA